MVGNLLAYSRDPLGFLTRCAREYGDVVRLGFPGPPAYLISHPNGVESVLVKNNRNFVRDRYTRAELRILGDGLLVNEGDSWRRQRRLAQPAFHRRRVEAFGETMVAFTERMLDGWRDGETRDVHAEMMRLTLEIVAKTLFDTDISREAEGVGRSMNAIMARSSGQGSSVFLRMLPESLPTPGNLAYRRATRRLDGLIHALVQERRRSGADAGDLLSMLLRAEDEDGEGMSDRQLRDEAMTIILAGHETTAIALSWTWYLLGAHPEAEARLSAELEEVLGGRAPAVEDLPRLRYADAVMKESMRLYPPAWAVGREAIGDCEIGGYRVPKGTQMFISQYVIQRDERFFRDPEAFDPDRWTNGSTEGLPPYAYFPFGGGPRLCIGNGFAKMEALLLLATVARRFRLELVSGRPPVPQPSITLRPRDGIQTGLRER
ncbi:cytochrome P450 [Rubrobacter marinus]|uniref:cytochrome P450 n=1 Tax=Rubrobacter marinus TaxID=2653852 RepID=UPI001A9DEA99